MPAFQKIFALFLTAILLNTAVESCPLFELPNNFKLQQTQQIKKSKKRQKRIVKKTVNKNKMTTKTEGVWGGTGIGFVIEQNGVQIEYDCAQGEIKQKFKTDANGNFNLNGFHTYQTSVVRVDFVLKPQAANFVGKISGATMKLKVTLTATNEVIGEFTLTRGAVPGLRKCR